MSTISTVIKKKFLKSLKIDLFHLFEEYILRLRKSQPSKTNKRIKKQTKRQKNEQKEKKQRASIKLSIGDSSSTHCGRSQKELSIITLLHILKREKAKRYKINNRKQTDEITTKE